MRKGVVFGIICILILSSFPLVGGGENYSNTISRKDRLDLIFDDIYDKMDDVNSQVECNLIFKEAVIELNKYGFLGYIDIKEVIKLVCCNDGSSYSISGKSSRTDFIGGLAVKFYELSNGRFKDVFILEGLTDTLFYLFYFMKHLGITRFPIGILSFYIDSWITFGKFSQDWEGGNEEWWPAEGWIKIVNPSGEVEAKYDYKFYGQIELIFEYGMDVNRIFSDLVGVKGFKGITIGDYYIGTAKIVDIGTNHPKLDWK